MYTLYFAKTLLMPLVVALLFALLLSPLVRVLKHYFVPRTFSAIVLLAAIGGPFTLLGIELAEPAQKWASRLPELSNQLTQELNNLNDSVSQKAKPAAKEKGFFSFFSSEEEAPPPSDDNPLSQRLTQGSLEVLISALSATPLVIAQFLTFLIMTLFLMIFGPHLYHQATEVLPQVKDKQYAANLVDKIQRELSRYILTVSLINTGLGMVTALTLWLMDFDDALLWGALVGLLNFAPYVGPLISVCILSIAGTVQYGVGWDALLPAAIYFSINLLEAQFITPLVLGRHMRLNPLMLILWLILWGWLWGAVGVLLAVPLLVCLKLVADQLNILSPWVALIEAPA
ncbi:AI-2E family transporter [Pseudomaricurvus sp.]|uniref:AI-2E family transporter n=1 Tax=Pseudomaricurvus sp. TaxID=2004510 RepID=UPI003F6D390C